MLRIIENSSNAIFNRIPIKDGYKEIEHDVVKMKLPVTWARIAFVIEALFYFVLFAYCYYLSATSAINVTTISYELLEGYECSILTPRKDEVLLSTSTSELVQFSKPRYNYKECLIALEETHKVCSPGNRKDLILNMNAMTTNPNNCFDVLLSDDFRFCYGKTDLLSTSDYSLTQFPRQPSSADFDFPSQLSYYFMHNNSKVLFSTLDVSLTSFATDLVSDLDKTIYAIASYKPQQGAQLTSLYKFEIGSPVVSKLFSYDNLRIDGLAVTDDFVYTLETSPDPMEDSIIRAHSRTVELESESPQVFSLSCNGVQNTHLQTASGIQRYLSVDEDGLVYVLCTSAVTKPKEGGASGGGPLFRKGSFRTIKDDSLQAHVTYIDTTEGRGREMLHAEVVEVASPFQQYPVSQPTMHVPVPLSPVMTRQHQHAMAGLTPSIGGAPNMNPPNIIAPSMNPPPPTAAPSSAPRPVWTFQFLRFDPRSEQATTMTLSSTTALPSYITQVVKQADRFYMTGCVAADQPCQILQVAFDSSSNEFIGNVTSISAVNIEPAAHMVAGFEKNSIYLADNGDYLYYNTTSESTERRAVREFVLPTSLQVGYSYQFCNESISSFVVDPSIISSFYDQCSIVNGLYYQSNAYLEIPVTCRGLMKSASDFESIVNCPQMNDSIMSFIASDCADSYEKVCKHEYTDNPPFSCSRVYYPSTITNLGTAFANAGGFGSFIFFGLKFLLKMFHPRKEYRYEYDEETGIFLPAATPANAYSQAGSKKVFVNARTDAVVSE